MFAEPRVHDHDGWVAAARRAAAAVRLDDVSDAFVESLGSRRLDLRSALGSYAVARVLPEHEFTASTASRRCAVCGQYPRPDEDLNVLSHERFKWGGIRRDNVRYVAFDLEQFSRAPRRGAGPTDHRLGRELIDTLRRLPGEVTASQSVSHLKMIKGNKGEREVILDILGVCGILRTADHHGYRNGFIPTSQRELPPQRFVERAYPVCWWRACEGIDDDALREFLPTLR